MTSLDATLAGVLDRFPELASVAVVPLGLSQFNTEPAMRLHTPDEAQRVVDVVDMWQDIFLSVLGRRMVFAADEYYLMTGRPFPPADAYEGFPMHEDGIGMARTFELEFEGRQVDPTGARRVLRRGRRAPHHYPPPTRLRYTRPARPGTPAAPPWRCCRAGRQRSACSRARSARR